MCQPLGPRDLQHDKSHEFSPAPKPGRFSRNEVVKQRKFSVTRFSIEPRSVTEEL